jgi:hypothetical protein
VHSEQHLIVCDNRTVDVAELERVGAPVPLVDDGFHLPSLSRTV